jgi:hypothetical protein
MVRAAETMNLPTPTLEIAPRTSSDLGFTLDVPVGFDRIVGREPSAGIAIGDPAVSRRHARVLHDASGVWVEDLGSTNGTFVNGDRLLERHRLRDGDELKFGDSVVLFHDDVTTQLHAQTPAAGVSVAVERCPTCGAQKSEGRWFCGHCGEQQRPIPLPLAVAPPSGAGVTSNDLIGPHGNVRRAAFRQAMRAGADGRRVRYSESLTLWTITFRMLVVCILIAAIVVGVAAADGATFGIGR